MDFAKFEFVAAYGTARQLPPSVQPEIVFSGRSNVGKSSLINKLCGRRSLARVSAQPGKTATINFYERPPVKKQPCAAPCFLVDLPGYGYAKTSFAEKKRWAELVEGYFAQARQITLLVQLVDFRHPISALDRDMLAFCSERGLPFVVAATKCDKLNKTERGARTLALTEELADYTPRAVIECSAVTGEGIASLRDAMQLTINNG
ncbi:MAG: ribosome biogenesis GTP-binding protein YihA/YsxC [Oscillospiraceae bacterium]|nr:ribosome biogenesis GTP-binding protein YihA/YsxC [Oscillospiraceae bacterium]